MGLAQKIAYTKGSGQLCFEQGALEDADHCNVSSAPSILGQNLFMVGLPFLRRRAVRHMRRQADAARDNREYMKAALFYEKVLRHLPDDAAIHVQCGHMLKEVGELDRAEQHYSRARVLTPNDPDLALQLGHFYKIAGRLDEAEVSYRRAAQLMPGAAEPVDELARLFRKRRSNSGENGSQRFAASRSRKSERAGSGVRTRGSADPTASLPAGGTALNLIRQEACAPSQPTDQDLDALLNDLLRPIDEVSRPNTHALRVALRDIEALKLNVKAFGYELAARLHEIAPPRDVKSPPTVQLRSKASTQADIESDWVSYWADQMKTGVVYHRKLWELCYVLQAIHEHGYMIPQAKGLGFGCGEEVLPSYLAARGVEVTVTDLPPEDARVKGWTETGEYTASLEKAFHSNLVDRASFDRKVRLRYVDMANIPNDLRDYDFCWSICALEHLGSIASGLDFIENSLKTLKPGGLAVHTTEFNFFNDRETIDNWVTVLFQRKHFQQIAVRLRAQGHSVAELDFDVGNQILDKFIDIPPYLNQLPEAIRESWSPSAHLKLVCDGFVITCFGLIIRKVEDLKAEFDPHRTRTRTGASGVSRGAPSQC